MDQYVLLTAVAAGIAWMVGFAIPTYRLVPVELAVVGVSSRTIGDAPLWAWLTLAAVSVLLTAAGTFARRALRPAAP